VIAVADSGAIATVTPSPIDGDVATWLPEAGSVVASRDKSGVSFAVCVTGGHEGRAGARCCGGTPTLRLPPPPPLVDTQH